MPNSPAIEVAAAFNTWLVYYTMNQRGACGFQGAILMVLARGDIPNTVQLGCIEVAPQDRRKGHGTRILRKLKSLANEHRVQLLAEVAAPKWTQAWYRKHGFVSTGRKEGSGVVYLRAPRRVRRKAKPILLQPAGVE